jgi:hypothetical protein
LRRPRSCRIVRPSNGQLGRPSAGRACGVRFTTRQSPHDTARYRQPASVQPRDDGSRCSRMNAECHCVTEVMASAISSTKLDVASKGAAWPAPSIRCVLAVGMAGASHRTRRATLSGVSCAVGAHDGDLGCREIQLPPDRLDPHATANPNPNDPNQSRPTSATDGHQRGAAEAAQQVRSARRRGSARRPRARRTPHR